MKKEIDRKDKLNAAEVVINLLANWKTAKSVILFASPVLRFKATRRKGQNEILLTFGRPNYAEKIVYKKEQKNKAFKCPMIFQIPVKKIKK